MRRKVWSLIAFISTMSLSLDTNSTNGRSLPSGDGGGHGWIRSEVMNMEGKIVTDICILAFFMILIVLRKYLFTEGFLEFLKKYWPAFGFPVAIILVAFIPEETSPYQEFILFICGLFVVYFFIYGYYMVNISSLRYRKGLLKKWQIVYISIVSLLPVYFGYRYFTTEPYHLLDVVIFVFFLGFVIYISRFLLKETFFSKRE